MQLWCLMLKSGMLVCATMIGKTLPVNIETSPGHIPFPTAALVTAEHHTESQAVVDQMPHMPWVLVFRHQQVLLATLSMLCMCKWLHLKETVEVTPTAVLHHQVCKPIILILCLQFHNVLAVCKTVQLLHFTLQLGVSFVPGLLCPGLGHNLNCNLLTGAPMNGQVDGTKCSRTDTLAQQVLLLEICRPSQVLSERRCCRRCRSNDSCRATSSGSDLHPGRSRCAYCWRARIAVYPRTRLRASAPSVRTATELSSR